MRKNYIDWLRNLAILYLFPFHTARIFDGFETNYIKGAESGFATNLILLSYWFMPLMFLLAGMSSFYALQRRTNSEYLRERVRRLLYPLLFGLLIIVPPQAFYAEKFHGGYVGGYLTYLKSYFTDFSDLSGYFGSFTPAHLWFILYLFLLSVMLLPLMRKIIGKKAELKLLAHPALILLAVIPLTLLSALPDIGGKNIFEFGGYLLLGCLIAKNEKTQEMIEKWRRGYLFAALLAGAGVVTEFYTIGWQEGFHPLGILFSLLHYFATLTALLAMLGYGKKYLNEAPKILRYFSQAAFPVYILHQTVLVVVGHYVLKITNLMPLQYLLILLLTFAATLLSYEVLRRNKVTRFLLGIK